MDLSELEKLGVGGGDGGMPSAEEMQQKKAQEAQMEEQRRSILDQILEPAAKDRLIRLALVKPEKARVMEDHLIKAATSGQLRSKVSEEQLITMLEGTGASQGGGKIKIQRRNYGMDSDDDDDDLL